MEGHHEHGPCGPVRQAGVRPAPPAEARRRSPAGWIPGSARQEQAQDIEQISKAITQMEQVKRRTAASAGESAAAATELGR